MVALQWHTERYQKFSNPPARKTLKPKPGIGYRIASQDFTLIIQSHQTTALNSLSNVGLYVYYFVPIFYTSKTDKENRIREPDIFNRTRSRCSSVKGGSSLQGPSNSRDVGFEITYRFKLTWRWCNKIIHSGGNIGIISYSLLFFVCYPSTTTGASLCLSPLSVADWKETLTKLEATAHSRLEVVTAHRHQIGGRLSCLRRLVVHNACPARWNVTRLINVHLHSCEPGSQFWRSIVFRLQWRGWWALPACFCRARPPHCQGTPQQSLAQPAMKSHHSINLLTHWKMNSQSRPRRVFTVYEILHANLLHVYTTRSSCRRTCKHEVGPEPSGQ